MDMDSVNMQILDIPSKKPVPRVSVLDWPVVHQRENL